MCSGVAEVGYADDIVTNLDHVRFEVKSRMICFTASQCMRIRSSPVDLAWVFSIDGMRWKGRKEKSPSM